MDSTGPALDTVLVPRAGRTPTSGTHPEGVRADRPQPGDVLSVTLEMHDAVTVVRLDGPVCAYTAGHLDTQLRELQHAGRHHLEIDASEVRPLCSAGVEVLLAHERRCTERGGDMVIRDPRPGVQRVLDVLSLQRLLGPVAIAQP